MTIDDECSKCGSTMQPGFVIDRGHMEYRSVQMWVEGEAEESFWSGLKTSGRNTYSVEAFRCGSCNRLEFYTKEKVSI